MEQSLSLAYTGTWLYGLGEKKRPHLQKLKGVYRHLPLFLFLTFLFSGFMIAQPDSTLSLRQCVEIALANHPALRSQSRQVDAATARYREARSAYFPELSAAAGHSQFFREHYNYPEQSAGLSLDWSPGDWFLERAASGAAEVQVQEAILADDQLALTLRLVGLYGQILQNRLLQQQYRERLDLLKHHIQINRALWEAGVRSRLDLLQTQAARARLRQDASAVAAQARVVKQELNRLLNRNAGEPLALRPFPEAPSPIDSLPPAPARFYPLLAGTPMVRSLNLQIEAESLRRHALTASRLPHLQLSGGYVADADPAGDGDYGRLSLEISLPLLQWGRIKYQNQAISASINALEAAREEALQELTIDLDARLTYLKQLQHQRRLQQEELAISEEAFTLASADYQAGNITNLEFLDAQQRRSENRLQILQTRLAIRLALIEIYIRTGQTEKISEITGE